MFFKNGSTVDLMSSFSVEINLQLMKTCGRLSFASSPTTKFIPLVQPRGLATTVVGGRRAWRLMPPGSRMWLPQPQGMAASTTELGKKTQVAQLCDFETVYIRYGCRKRRP